MLRQVRTPLAVGSGPSSSADARLLRPAFLAVKTVAPGLPASNLQPEPVRRAMPSKAALILGFRVQGSGCRMAAAASSCNASAALGVCPVTASGPAGEVENMLSMGGQGLMGLPCDGRLTHDLHGLDLLLPI